MRGILMLAALFVVVAETHGQEMTGGGWRGTWVDNNSGHVGALRARFRPTRDGNYRATFSGTYYKVIPFVFSTKLNVVGHDGAQTILEGQTRLMGFYPFSYQAVGDGHHFNSQYQSGRWVGEFNLSR